MNTDTTNAAESYTPETVHIWVGTFASETAFREYAAPPARAAEGCVFFREYGLAGGEIAAGNVNAIYKKGCGLMDILNIYAAEPLDIDEVTERARQMEIAPAQVNAVIILADCTGRQEKFEEAAKSGRPRVVYLGEFMIDEPEDIAGEGRYDAYI